MTGQASSSFDKKPLLEGFLLMDVVMFQVTRLLESALKVVDEITSST
jgi:hypothetical protein